MTPVEIIHDALARSGVQVKWKGDALEAQCPAHPDNHPSLTVKAGTKRDAVIHCFAGCSPDAVMAAIGLKWTDLSPKKERSQTVATYVYEKADGTKSFKVDRTADKEFFQTQWTPSGWGRGLGDAERVVYHLPEVIKAIEKWETIYVAEGEKDVDALRRLGVTATCNSMGAGKWTQNHAEYLRGAINVVVVADNDAVGMEHAANVVFTLDLVGVPATIVKALKGKDAADHIAAGFTLEQFVPVDLTPKSSPEATDDGLPLAVNWQAFWSHDTSEAEWLVEPLLPKGRMIAMYAPAKAGKSLLALEVAAAVATGRPVLGRPAGEPVDVCYFDLEMTEADLQERLIGMGYNDDDDLSHFHYYLMPTLPPLDTYKGGQTVLAVALKDNADFVVFDTMARVVEGKENDADTYRSFTMHTAFPLKARGITILRLDHAGKDLEKGQRGSSEKNGDVDLVWQMTVTEMTDVALKATHRRVGWVPLELKMTRTEDPCIAHNLTENSLSWPAGTKDCADDLDALGLPVDASANACQKALKAAGKGYRRQVVLAAKRFRDRELGLDDLIAGTTNRSTTYNQDRNQPGTPGTTQSVPMGTGCSDVVGTSLQDQDRADWMNRLKTKTQTPTATPLDPINNPADRNPANWNFIDDEPKTPAPYAQEPT